MGLTAERTCNMLKSFINFISIGAILNCEFFLLDNHEAMGILTPSAVDRLREI